MSPPASRWLVIALYPDVCATKGVPVPYMIVSDWEAAELASGNVAYNGCLALTVASITRSCQGDEAGDAGTTSGTVGQMCSMKGKSDSVFINGFNAVRHGDIVQMNCSNTLGKFLIIPAVAKSSDPGALKGAAFDHAVGALVDKMLNEKDPAGKLYTMRNPQPDDGTQDLRVVNNPVIVAAEYFFQGAKMASAGKAGGVLVNEWMYAKKCGGSLPYSLATTSIEAPLVGELNLFRLKMNKNQPPSEYDDQFLKWAKIGFEAAGGPKDAVGGILCPSEQFSQEVESKKAAAIINSMPPGAARDMAKGFGF